MSHLNARHDALVSYIAATPGQTAKEIAEHFESHAVEALQATDNATRCALRRLIEKGLIEFRSTKTTRQHPRYYVTTSSQPVDQGSEKPQTT